jgi:enoyl-CoA hydratase/carnithine racemase
LLTDFAEYHAKYATVRMEREDRILQLTFHTDGGPLQWGWDAARDWIGAFRDVGNDPRNKVIIMTGTGNVFSGPRGTPATSPVRSPRDWEEMRFGGSRLLSNLLAIEAPIISAINGPALRHMDTPLLADVVLAADDTVFQDSGHLISDTVPGDGMHVVMPLLMGLTRARYFLFTGQELSVAEAREMGLVNEVLPRDELLPRAWELARGIAGRPDLVVRHTRLLLTHQIRRQILDLVGYGFALEGAGVTDRWAMSRQAEELQ